MAPRNNELKNCSRCNQVLTVGGYCFQCRAWTGQPMQPPRRPVRRNTEEPPREPRVGRQQLRGMDSRLASLPDSENQTKQIVQAINRTTYAVRALGIWLFATVNTFFLWNNCIVMAERTALRCSEQYGDCGASGWVSFSWLVLSVGLSLSVYLGVTELRKSQI